MKLVIFILIFFSFSVMAGQTIGDVQHKRITFKAGDRTADFDETFSASAVPIWTIPAKTAIVNIDAFVVTALTATNDATALIVGDGDDDNGFLTQGFGDITGPHADGYNSDAFRGAYLAKASDVDTIKYYAATDTLDMTITTDTASALLTGEVIFDIYFKRFN